MTKNTEIEKEVEGEPKPSRTEGSGQAEEIKRREHLGSPPSLLFSEWTEVSEFLGFSSQFVNYVWSMLNLGYSYRTR